ncbi:MAG: RdgB/HAM1 family non-canonical purine NTP pyrophosphatase [bacterium]
MKLLIATGNRHKFQEISAILAVPHLTFINLLQIDGAPPVVEDGETFEANAIKKAVTLARYSGMWTLADDSGLEVDALHGAPGVYSARYAGEPSDDDANNRKVMGAMEGVLNRQARFRCAIALSDPCGVARTVSGACEGHLLSATRGAGGFGYDPLFVPNGYEQTFAELPTGIKNAISHRACALRLALAAWRDCLRQELPAWLIM